MFRSESSIHTYSYKFPHTHAHSLAFILAHTHHYIHTHNPLQNINAYGAMQYPNIRKVSFPDSTPI